MFFSWIKKLSNSENKNDNPHTPAPKAAQTTAKQVWPVHYQSPSDFTSACVGAKNFSPLDAQGVAKLSKIQHATWAT